VVKVLSPALLGGLEPAVIQIAHRHELDAGHRDRRGGVAAALDAGADERELNLVVGRRRLLAIRNRLFAIARGCRHRDRCGSSCAAGRADETAPGGLGGRLIVKPPLTSMKTEVKVPGTIADE
jgi:hypothetical protein